MSTAFLSRFTPRLMEPEMLEAIFVQRQEQAQYLVEVIRESVNTQNKHFQLLIGARGTGKSFLIALIYHRIYQMKDLRDKLLIAWLREEEWGISSFLDLLFRIFRSLEETYPKDYQAELHEPVEYLYQLSADDAEQKAANLLYKFVKERTVLLLVENLDDLFEGLGDTGQKKLRAYIQNYSFLTILATAQSLFNGVKEHNQPF